ncbi:hypothetical protein BJ165DRAFT_1118997 [Panaeolus papilionaceus]|nr:hypothetical protein BJ165DRAFT_1118997 [Panaeolus papilionaceus]
MITGTQASIFAYPIPTANYTPSFFTQIITPAGIPAPTNVAAGTRQVACGYYYTVESGDTLNSIATLTNTTADGLISWNPELSKGSPSGLVVGKAICVLFPKGNYTLSPAPVPANLAISANVNTTTCAEYYTIASGDSCTSIEDSFALTNAQFLALNPGVNAQCTNIILGEAYCVFSIFGGSAGPTPIGPPANVAPGTITTNCTGYYTVVSGDSCGAIESKFNITSALFLAMNPEVSSTCNNIVIGEAYCIGTSNTTTTPNGPPSNVAPGTITTGCTAYYTVVSGDSCGAIESRFNISDSLFHAMNPEITSTCTNIILGDAYCVATSNTTTPTGPPSNLATGSLNNCTTYYTVVSGDSCTAIDNKFTITLSDFFRWNPEVNTACTNIAVGSAYCVTGGGNACKKEYTVVSGDFCGAIESSQGVTAANLQKLNPWLDSNCDIQIGQRLCVG